MTTTDRPPLAHRLEDLSLAQLWVNRVSTEQVIAEARDFKTALDQELKRRVLAERPDFEPESAGGAVIADEDVVVTMTWDRDYGVNEEALLQLMGLLTAGEYAQLAKWKPSIDGIMHRQLLKRGGEVAELLNRARFVKSARPKFDAKPRA